MASVLEYSVFAMDSYNRDYSLQTSGAAGGSGLNADPGQNIGDAEIVWSSAQLGGDPRVDMTAGFFAVAYRIGNEIVLSFRGTDYFPQDSNTGYSIAWGNYAAAQAQLAILSYQAVRDDPNLVGPNDTIVTTGHSLGGGLAGFVASLYHLEAHIFSPMPFHGAANAAYNTGRDYEEGWPLIYGEDENPPVPDWSGVHSYHLMGELLTPLRGFEPSLPISMPPADYPPEVAEENPFTFYSMNDDSIARHNPALHTIRLAASASFDDPEQSWMVGGQFVLPGLFKDENANFAQIVSHTNEASAAADEMIGIIAYSALESGSRPFGTTAATALNGDIRDLGEAILQTTDVTPLFDIAVAFGWTDLFSVEARPALQLASKRMNL